MLIEGRLVPLKRHMTDQEVDHGNEGGAKHHGKSDPSKGRRFKIQDLLKHICSQPDCFIVMFYRRKKERFIIYTKVELPQI